jgi:hypothetical protein
LSRCNTHGKNSGASDRLWSAEPALTRRPSHVYRQVVVVILVDAWNPESSRGLHRLENYGDDDKVHG